MDEQERFIHLHDKNKCARIQAIAAEVEFRDKPTLN